MSEAFKINRMYSISEERGILGIIKVGGRAVKVAYHQEYDLSFGLLWVLCDVETGTRIRTGNTRAMAKKESLDAIKNIGSRLFFTARKKFKEICYGGKSISEFKGKSISRTKDKKYQAWAKKNRIKK